MHHPTDRVTHTTAFVTPVVEHWLIREIAQWVHSTKERAQKERKRKKKNEIRARRRQRTRVISHLTNYPRVIHSDTALCLNDGFNTDGDLNQHALVCWRRIRRHTVCSLSATVVFVYPQFHFRSNGRLWLRLRSKVTASVIYHADIRCQHAAGENGVLMYEVLP